MRGAGKLEIAGVEDRLRRGALAGGQRRQRKERLDRRAGRIRAAQRAVQKRLVQRFVQQLPIGGVDAVDEQVGIEAGSGDHREHLPCGGIERHQRAAAGPERGFRHFLQLDVERQREIVARRRRDPRERAHRAPAGVDLDVLDSGRAVQFAFVRELDPDLADVVGALVVRRLAPLVDAREIAVVDAADVADDVRCELAVRVLPEEPGLDLDARKTVPVDREARDLVIGEARAQRQALEALRLVHELLEPLPVARLDFDNLRQRIDRLVEILDARRLDFERVRRIALREHDAVAVADHAAIGHDRHDRDAVRLGQRLVVAVLDDLQVEEAREKPDQRERDQSAGDRQPPPEEVGLTPRILELGRSERGAAAAPAGSEEEACHG